MSFEQGHSHFKWQHCPWVSALLLFVGTFLAFCLASPAGADRVGAAQSCTSRPGDLDTSFGGDGRVLASINSNDSAWAIAVQADGKIIVAGGSDKGSGSDFALLRLEPDGSFDTAFGSNGHVAVDFFGGEDVAYAVVIQPDGKIIVAGSAYNGLDRDFAVARFLPNGSLDGSFDGDGRLVTDVAGANDVIRGLALQPNGEIVVAGTARNGGATDFVLARYMPGGSPDGTFGSGGLVVSDVGGSYDAANALLRLDDGRLVAAGESWNGANYDLALVRYLPNGNLDGAFGTGGLVTLDVNGRTDRAMALVALPDGRLVVAGHTSSLPIGGNYDFLLAAFQTDGVLDADFGSGGLLTNDLSPDDSFLGLARQPDGKLVAAGYLLNSNYDFAAYRFFPDGTVDSSFGANGLVMVNVGGGVDLGRSLAVQPDGRLLLAGFAQNGGASDFGVARLDQPFACALRGLLPIDGVTDVGNYTRIGLNSEGPCDFTVTRLAEPMNGYPLDSGELPFHWVVDATCPTPDMALSLCYEQAELALGGAIQESGLRMFHENDVVGGVVDSAANCVTVSSVTGLGVWRLRDVSPTAIQLDSVGVVQGDSWWSAVALLLAILTLLTVLRAKQRA